MIPGAAKSLTKHSRISYPAKMARGLVRRIFDYLIETGRLTKNSVVVDPFGGIGTTGIEGASRGMRCFGCELEPRFHKLSLDNIELHRRTWEHFGDPIPVLVQGDSRRLCETLGPLLADCVISSPPYAEAISGSGRHGIKCENRDHSKEMSNAGEHVYGQSPGQLGAMRPGSVDAVISSPPYASGTVHGGEQVGSVRKDGSATGLGRSMSEGYGTEEGNLGNMKPGTVDAATRADCVISSPPYEGSILAHDSRDEYTKEHVNHGGSRKASRAYAEQGNLYGDTTGQLGTETGQTFWSAAREIVAQCHQILRPGGVAVWVCKDFVRNKARVPFSADWVRLCEAEGFRLVEWIQASLVKTSEAQLDLFGGDPHVKTTERKSFFRRLAEKKGSPRIDWEDVLVMERVDVAGVAAGVASAVVGSPPYSDQNVTAGNAGNAMMKESWGTGTDLSKGRRDYGTSPGQLGSMKPGTVDAVIGSPPFCGIVSQTDRLLESGSIPTANGGDNQGGTLRQTGRCGDYGTTPGQLGQMKPGNIDDAIGDA